MADTVTAAVMTAPFRIRSARREIKPPGPGEVELRVGYVGICGSDLHAFQGTSPIFDFPVVFGHEFSAQVMSCGAGVDRLQEGQWVSVAPLLACGDCSLCRSGKEHLCRQRAIFGARIDGALRERLIMPARLVYPLPAGVSARAGALGEPLAVAVHGVNRIGGKLEGARVLISGAGAIGLLIALVAEQHGADQILLLEVDEKRLDFARSLGFDAVHPAEAPTSIADYLLIATGAAAAITAIPSLLAPSGTAVVVGLISEAQLNWFQLLLKEGSVATSRYFTLADFQEGLQLLNTPGFRANLLIEEQVRFADLFIGDGQQVMTQAKHVTRLLVKMI